MKIGVDATALVQNPTGVGNYLKALLLPLCEAHQDANFVLFSNDSISFPLLPNVKFLISRPKRRGPHWQNTHLRSMMAQEQLDVFWGTNGLLPLWIPSGIATALTVHDLVYKFAPETLPGVSYWGRRICQRLAVRSADQVIYVSEATAADATASYGRPPDAVLHPLADPFFSRPTEARIGEVREKHGLRAPYLLSLGTLEPRKNIVRLIDAYLNRRGAGVNLPTLALAGGKGWLDSEIAERIAQGESLGFVRRLGYVDQEDLPALYAACTAFLMPSVYEGFGMPLLEAQMCGAAVIHGPHASMHEASGSLGVETAVDITGISRMLDALAANSLPLCCRLPAGIVNDPAASASRLWGLLRGACARRARLNK